MSLLYRLVIYYWNMVTSGRDDKWIDMCVKIYRWMSATVMNAGCLHYNKRQIIFASEANTSGRNYRVEVTGEPVCTIMQETTEVIKES